MKVHVGKFLAYGDMELCEQTALPGRAEQAGSMATAIVHACKDPDHRRVVGYTGRAPAKDDPHYYSRRIGLDLYLNLIDPPVPLFAAPVFLTALAFLEEHIGRLTYVHCNEGVSRSPSLVLLHLARQGKLRDSSSYAAARAEFVERWPYAPGKGFQIWLEQNWGRLMTWRHA